MDKEKITTNKEQATISALQAVEPHNSSDAWTKFQEKGAVSSKTESWKYAPFSSLLRTRHQDSASKVSYFTFDNIEEGKVTLKQTLQAKESFSKAENKSHLSWLARAFAENIQEIEVNESPTNSIVIHANWAQDLQEKEPVVDKTNSILPSLVLRIKVKEGQKVNFILEDNFANSSICLIIIDLEKYAECRILRCIPSKKANKFCVAEVSLAQKSNCHIFDIFIAKEESYLRSEVSTAIAGEKSEIHYDQIAISYDKSVIDLGSLAKHQKSITSSRQDLRCVSYDNSRIGASGEIAIEKNCPESEGYQLLRGMTLSDNAKIELKPALEIFTDAVKCSHGATVARPDDESLFYLRQRGINKETATNILLHAFLSERLSSLNDNKDLRNIAEKWLNKK